MTAISHIDGAAPMPQWGVLQAEGAEAAAFLHGQLTQDVLSLGAHQARLAAYCSPKGRMLASFVVWRPEPDRVLLACHRSVLGPTLKRLSMFVLRAKCRLSDASDACALVGLAGPTATAAVGAADVWQAVASTDGAVLIRLPDAAGVTRVLRAGGSSDASAMLPPMPEGAWAWLEVQSGVATIEAATADRFVPQMVNYEQLDGVNFQKGCYPGQEIVARSQYRGTAKRRAFLFEADAAAAPGDEIHASDDPGQPAGVVVNAAPAPGASAGRYAVLAEVKLASVDSGASLHLAGPDGPMLESRPLPYPLIPA